MLEQAANNFPFETGGLLVGYWASKSEVVINKCVGPGPSALHNLDSFTPDYAYQEREMSRLYYESRRLHFYLGDWHTHPKGVASLSRRDRKTLKNIARSKEARVASPLMCILAGEEEWNVRVWRYDCRGHWSLGNIKPFLLRSFE
jgi:integrative and conjugative element protein (TIGR02256 family)